MTIYYAKNALDFKVEGDRFEIKAGSLPDLPDEIAADFLRLDAIRKPTAAEIAIAQVTNPSAAAATASDDEGEVDADGEAADDTDEDATPRRRRGSRSRR